MANDDSFIVSVAAVGNRFGFLYWTAAGNDLGKNECYNYNANGHTLQTPLLN